MIFWETVAYLVILAKTASLIVPCRNPLAAGGFRVIRKAAIGIRVAAGCGVLVLFLVASVKGQNKSQKDGNGEFT